MIPVLKLRDLTLEEASGDERSANVSAASALVHIGDTLFVIADDEKQLSIFPAEARQPGYQIQIIPGPVPKADEERSQKKPDLESLVHLPPGAGSPHGALMTFASGTKHRDAAVVIPLDDQGAPTGETQQVDLTPLYDALRAEIDDFNIEGCAATGDVLHLFQRGNDDGGRNARIDLSLQGFTETMQRGAPITSELVIGITDYELGQLQGVKLCFSDASPLEDGRLVFTCSAEASGSGDDGRVVGSAIGIMEADGSISTIEPVDLDVKIEGMTAFADDDRIRVLMVTDADDPSVPSPLLEAILPPR